MSDLPLFETENDKKIEHLQDQLKEAKSVIGDLLWFIENPSERYADELEGALDKARALLGIDKGDDSE